MTSFLLATSLCWISTRLPNQTFACSGGLLIMEVIRPPFPLSPQLQPMVRTSTSGVALGLRYLPASVKLPILRQEDVFGKLEGRGVRYIRFQWVDYTNVTRYRVIPLTAFRKLLSASRPGITLTKAVFGIIGASVAPGFSSTGEYLYTPDLNSTRICGYAPGHACLMGWFEEKLPIRENAGKEVAPTGKLPLCPRGLLRDIVKCVSLKEIVTPIFTKSDSSKGKVLGVDFLVGFETEFILLKSTHPIEAASNAPWSASRALPSGSVAAKCLEDIADALQNSDIELLMYHAESAPGQVWYYTTCRRAVDTNPDRQYEIVTGPLPPLEAADAVVFTRETIVNMAAMHGLRATFSPRVNADSCKYSAFRFQIKTLSLVDHRRHCSSCSHIPASHISATHEPASGKSKY